MGFSIDSPHLARVEAGMERTNIGLVARDAAVTVADMLVNPLKRAATAAGASSGMVSAIQTHDGHLNDLVMRDRGSKGDVIVGVGGENPYADEAEELEWGTPDTAPRAWVRTTAQQRAVDVGRAWGNELSRELDRSVLR